MWNKTNWKIIQAASDFEEFFSGLFWRYFEVRGVLRFDAPIRIAHTSNEPT